jgi:NitT/TauT family transport system substrate-binding protein
MPTRHGCAVAIGLRPIVLLVAALEAFACVAPPPQPLRIGSSPWTGYEPLFLARDRGYLSSDTARLVEYTSTSESSRAFRNGALDAVMTTLDEVARLKRDGVGFKVILVADISHGGDVILGRPGLDGLAALKGRRVGFESSSIGDYVLTRALQQVGLTPDDVEGVRLEFAEHERAFVNGEIDAVVTYEPVRTRLLAAGARQLFDSSQIPGEILDVLVCNEAALAARGDDAAAVVVAWFRALDDIAAGRPDTLLAMAQRERISAAEFAASLHGVRLPGVDENRRLLGGPTPALLAPARRLVEIMVAGHLLAAPVDFTGVFDATHLPPGGGR